MDINEKGSKNRSCEADVEQWLKQLEQENEALIKILKLTENNKIQEKPKTKDK